MLHVSNPGFSPLYNGPIPSDNDLKDFPRLDGLIRKRDVSDQEQYFILKVANLIRAAVGKNPSFEDLKKLAEDRSPQVRAGVAANMRAKHDLLEKLGSDKEEIVRAAVALNPYYIVRRLQQDPSRLVRLRLAQNKNTPALLLGYLSDDSDPLVRKAVYMHANTPPEARQKLMEEFKSPRSKNGEE